MWRREGGVSGGGGDGGGGGGDGGGGGVGVSRGVCGLARLTHSPLASSPLSQSVSSLAATQSHTHRLSHSHSVSHTVPSVRSDGDSHCG